MEAPVSDLTPTPAPWMQERVSSGLIMVRSPATPDGKRTTIAAVDGPNCEADAALICIAPPLADAIRTGNFAEAVAIVAALDAGFAS